MSTEQDTPPEIRRRLKIEREPRTLSGGGRVIGYGYRNTEHCYLDFLRNEGLLGPAPEDGYRYDTGYRLRLLYFSFHTSAKSMTEVSGGSHKSLYTSEAEVGSDNDKAETRFHDLMRLMPAHRREVRFVCLEDVSPVKGTPEFHTAVRKGLDDLQKAFMALPEDFS